MKLKYKIYSLMKKDYQGDKKTNRINKIAVEKNESHGIY